MPRDLSKKEQPKYSKKAEHVQKKKKNNTSDSDNNSQYSDSENEEEMDIHEFRKYIHKIFPSKHLDHKIKAGEKLKTLSKKMTTRSKKQSKEAESSEEEDDDDHDSAWDTEEEEEEKPKEKCKKPKKKPEKAKNKPEKTKPSKKKMSSDEEDDDDSEEEEADFEEEKSPKKSSKNKQPMSIIFTIGGDDDETEWDDYDEDYDEDEFEDDEFEEEAEEDEDEDVSVSTDASSYEEDEAEEEEEERRPSKKHEKEQDKEQDKEKNTICDDNTILKELRELFDKNPKDKSIQKCVEMYEKDIRYERERKTKKEKKQKEKNMRIFRKIMSDKNLMNDYSFYEKLECEHQKKLIKELREINKITRIEKPYRMTLLEADIPVQLKAVAFKKVNALRYMEPGSGEYYKIKNWVDTFMKIPFNHYESLPINISDGVEKCHEFMENALQLLNNAVYGLNDAKMQIMQMMGQLLINPTSIGTAIAIHGPPGTGKTSLVKEGISKILNRPFAFIALGGATDSSFLEGHGYTYEGSTWGKIVQILIESKCMNPVIYFDELDKISDTPRGEEIAGILTHLTDTTQNSQFHDKYFAEVNFDLSKCLFIFSYNDESKINPILKDRMYRIKTNGYSGKEKHAISQHYLLPKIREQVKFNDSDIIITDDIISYINDTHCQKENGVRNLKRCLEIIHTKLNLYRLMKSGTNLFEKEMTLHVEFPFKVTREIVDKLIKRESDGLETWRSLYN